MKIKKIVIWIGLVILILGLIYELLLFKFYDSDTNYFQIDRCIDSIGCWDETDNICRKHEINSQELCDRKKVDGRTLEQRVEENIKKITK